MELYFIYIIHFAISLILGGLFCIGLWNSSQGEIEVRPNGEKVTEWGMIFYPIHKFLSQTKEEKVYYIDNELDKLIEKIKCDFKQHGAIITDIQEVYNGIKIIGEDLNFEKTLWDSLLCDIEKKYCIKSDIEKGIIRFAKIYEVPIFNEYITKPLLLCYKCYASIWGTVIFILTTLFAIRVRFIPKDFIVLIPMWVVYVFALVNVNIFIYKKTK